MMHNKPEASFCLKNSNLAFNERQKNIFDQLNSLKCNLKNNEDEMDVDRGSSSTKFSRDSGPRTKHRSFAKHFKGKESIFKVPQDPANYMKKIPDFKKNPHKWTKYSLADVKDEDISEAGNTRAALSFLDELRKRNSNEPDEDEATGSTDKIVFQRRSTKKVDGSDNDAKCTYRGSKVVMPEYVVGQKIKKDKKVKKTPIKGDIKLKLDHLYEED